MLVWGTVYTKPKLIESTDPRLPASQNPAVDQNHAAFGVFKIQELHSGTAQNNKDSGSWYIGTCFRAPDFWKVPYTMY